MEYLLIAGALVVLTAARIVRQRTPGTSTKRTRARGRVGAASPGGDYPGDFTGIPQVSYSPSLDGAPDPGEIVWTWVPFEEDFSRGKDRPVLLIGRDGPWLVGLMFSSKDHDNAPTSSGGPVWLDVGTGAWDRQRRPSEVRLDRMIRVDPAAVRREGAVVDRKLFDSVIRAARSHQGW